MYYRVQEPTAPPKNKKLAGNGATKNKWPRRSCGPPRREQEGCNRKDTDAWRGKSRRRARLTGLARTQKPSHVQELSRRKHRNQGIAGHGERGPLARLFESYLAGKGGSKPESDAVCSVLEASRAANSGPTTQEQVPRSRVSRVSETRAASSGSLDYCLAEKGDSKQGNQTLSVPCLRPPEQQTMTKCGRLGCC